MKPLSQNDIESELSYAYLHAVAAKALANCQVVTKLPESRGIDAVLTAWIDLPDKNVAEVDLKIQLKATVQPPSKKNGYLSYSLHGIERYNDLRVETITTQRILVVLFLPDTPSDWLTCSESELAVKKAAYWVSLRGAKDSTNTSSQTVYLPKRQLLTPSALSEIFARLANRETLTYEQP